MDFWSRLIAGTSLLPGNKAAVNSPDKRLARFKRVYNQLLQTWRNTSHLAQDSDAASIAQSNIQELTKILSDEAIRPSPHACVSFAASKQMYLAIGKIATTSYHEAIIREAVTFFSTLIESEEEDFLESNDFSQSLMNLLIRITGANSIRLSSETEIEVVELAFGIAAKIRLQPEILPAWFRETHDALNVQLGAHEKFAGRTHKEDFPLFYLLIDYIHHEGRVGDFARTGLLYIIEAASTSMALEQWIVESDLATLMATGLGALYSQLSRKLVIDYPPDEVPSVLALSDYSHPRSTSEIVSSASQDFQGHMETFLSHLVFWQDVLEHCKSSEVKQTLLEHFQVIFLQQLLYPSLLESSDVDGGSSVAVLTYLRRILEAVDHPDVIHMILHYLLALPDTSTPRKSASRASISAARERKSMDLQNMMASQPDLSTPSLFNLVDLILGSLTSPNQQTIDVALRLLSTIFSRHHRYALSTLLKTTRAPLESTPRSIGAHEAEIDYLMGLLDAVGTDGNLEQAYENHVKDAAALLECHSCSQSMLSPMSVDGVAKSQSHKTTLPGAPQDLALHTIRPDDPIMKSLIGVLNNFFLNPIEVNLSLTQTIVDLSLCGYLDISGWLIPDPSRYTYDSDEEVDDAIAPMTASTLLLPTLSMAQAQSRADTDRIRQSRRRPQFPPARKPRLLSSLQELCGQASSYRAQIPRFTDLLAQRKHALTAEPGIPRSLPYRSRLQQDANDARSDRSPSPAGRQSAFDSLTQRIFSDRGTSSKASTPRKGSPRGRSSHEGANRSGTSTPVRSGRSPMPSESASNRLSPRVGARAVPTRAFSPSPLRINDENDEIAESQSRALEGLDRGILNRRVTLPRENGSVFANLHRTPPAETLPKADESQDGQVESDGMPLEQTRSNETASDMADEDNDKNLIGADDDDRMEEEIEKTVSVNHILTNTLVLQEFILELIAIVQVRAGLFGEVEFV